MSKKQFKQSQIITITKTTKFKFSRNYYSWNFFELHKKLASLSSLVLRKIKRNWLTCGIFAQFDLYIKTKVLQDEFAVFITNQKFHLSSNRKIQFWVAPTVIKHTNQIHSELPFQIKRIFVATFSYDFFPQQVNYFLWYGFNSLHVLGCWVVCCMSSIKIIDSTEKFNRKLSFNQNEKIIMHFKMFIIGRQRFLFKYIYKYFCNCWSSKWNMNFNDCIRIKWRHNLVN